MIERMGTVAKEPLMVHVCETLEEARKGYNDMEMKDGEGMMFVFTEPLMLPISVGDEGQPLDVMWLHSGRIVAMASHRGGILTCQADAVLEVPLGWCAEKGIKLGDKVMVSGAEESVTRH